MDDFWDRIRSLTFGNEADVEVRLVVPLLRALGYGDDDIRPKYGVLFREGRRGRKPEADFVVFYGPVQNKDTSLVVVEAKAPGESFEDAKSQGESYSFNVRAPLLVITDGIRFEVWQLQPSIESQKVLDLSVTDIASERGRVEAILSKEAARSYCHSLQHKKIASLVGDFRAYEIAEVRRTNKVPIGVERSLKSAEGRSSTLSSTLLADFRDGAIVRASSGYGKSTLARDLHRQALEARWTEPSLRLSFEIWLPDLLEVEQSLPNYARERLAAHCPQVAESVFGQLLREQGVIFICDGFNRVARSSQSKVESSLKRLIRDFPKVQAFVFTGKAVTPDLRLPILDLEGLDAHQQNQVAETIFPTLPYIPTGTMPALLRGLAEHPLLLTLILDHYRRTGVLPNRVVDIFQTWENRVLDYDASVPSTLIECEKALMLLANATLGAPIGRQAAVALLRANGIEPFLLDELVSRDAVQLSSSTVELVHESLADYLRAYAISRLDEAEALLSIGTIPLEGDSFLPILLMALLPTRRLQKALWRRLSKVGFSTYLQVVRYRADMSETLLKQGSHDTTEACLEDLLEPPRCSEWAVTSESG